MSPTSLRMLATFVILLALVTIILAMLVGGDILMIVFGLCFAASSMALFRSAQPSQDDKD